MRGELGGSFVALPTPFQDGRIDYAALRALVDRQLDAGTDGLVVAGTTGEAATLRPAERWAVVELVAGVAGGRVPVVAGVGTNDTRATCELARGAERAGADALLVVTPYYNRPTRRGLSEHFLAVAGATDLPVVLYNVPSRTGTDLPAELALELARTSERIVAIKEATSAERVREIAAAGDLDVFCGEDAWIVDGMLNGACGVIGVVANLVPERVAALVRACALGDDVPRAAALAEELAPLVAALFAETNPGPLKHALGSLGLCRPEVRPPLAPVEPATAERLAGALRRAGLRPA